ncbi:hypothetical protein F0562_035102 [Nyssa sinensis]|uniref:AAA+ ATPase domain-containing protein n=1 Tax=Nyssa sinensis TaxID=561372 RepID=A0A5J5ACT4_9ASTE|nr:hypothetical protein F0562_035102 [Nyssa sinensis]
MATPAVGLLIGKIVSVLENEASLIGGVHDELSDFKRELVSIRSFLEDADGKRALTKGEKSWVEDVREMAYNVEDIIDEFMYRMSREQSAGRLTRLFYKTIHISKNLWVRHHIATKVQKMKKMIKDIPERNQRYGFNHIEETNSCDDLRWMQNQAECSLFVKDDDLVGIEDARQSLVRLLTDGEPQRAVISVVGMGGSGKTTLVASASKSQIVKQHFDCHAWISVSQSYDIEDLLKRLIKEFIPKEEVQMADLSTMRHKELLEKLVNYLRLKRYVVVLDDVWGVEPLNDLRVSLPDERNESRVMLTTRKEDVASSAASSFGVKSHVHHVEPLGMNNAWDLFCMKAFSNSPNRSCPQELENLARALVEKCEGLPLAIVALGGLMSSKNLESEWREVYNSLNWHLSNDEKLDRMKTILWLSFNNLPYRLKGCFLYCCLFPEDYLIRRKRLIRLWMAEGFVEKVKGKTPEEVSDGYLKELVDRSMLQVVERNQSGRTKTCKLHDLMRELALSTSETERFCGVYDGQEASEENRPRRLSVQTSDGETKTWNGMSQLRSLLVFVVDRISPSWKTLPPGFRLLRVLDMEDVPIVTLPDELVNLFNLRYLNLKRTKVKELPKSIGRLHNLQTLDIRDSDIDMLPAGITKLQNLRHLIMYRYRGRRPGSDFEFVYGTPAPSNICKLKHLQVLACAEAETGLMKRIRQLTQLTRIGITKVKEADERDLCISIQNMNLLRYLFVMVTDEQEYLRTDALSSAPPRLKTLVLVGRLENVPSWFHSLQNLTFLYLHWSRLEEDPLHYIQALPNLGKLLLITAYLGKQLCFGTGFRKLNHLRLGNLPQLNEIIIENGVMPDLEKLYVGKCKELRMLPRGIKYLTNIQELTLAFVSNELTKRIRGETSVDRQMIRHIPKISHVYQSPSGIFFVLFVLIWWCGAGGVAAMVVV